MKNTRTTHVLIQILNCIPWLYFYIPGLYIFLADGLTFALAIQFMRYPDSAGWIVSLLNLLVSIIINFLFHSGIARFVAWYTFKDVQFANPHETQPTQDDTTKSMESFVRRFALSALWRYAHLPGVFLLMIAFAIVAFAINLHRRNPHATDWGTVLILSFSLVLGAVFNVAGLAICGGWYVFKDIDIKGAEGTRPRHKGISSVGQSKKDSRRLSVT